MPLSVKHVLSGALVLIAVTAGAACSRTSYVGPTDDLSYPSSMPRVNNGTSDSGASPGPAPSTSDRRTIEPSNGANGWSPTPR